MGRYFIRTKDQEGFVEAESIREAFDEFVLETPLEKLGVILIGHIEYFSRGHIPDDAWITKVTAPLARLGIWSKEDVADFNEEYEEDTNA
tara:strand:- start:152 stop:421 length:270 start_codon:yes stop_codon:yes gene_type:complete